MVSINSFTCLLVNSSTKKITCLLVYSSTNKQLVYIWISAHIIMLAEHPPISGSLLFFSITSNLWAEKLKGESKASSAWAADVKRSKGIALTVWCANSECWQRRKRKTVLCYLWSILFALSSCHLVREQLMLGEVKPKKESSVLFHLSFIYATIVAFLHWLRRFCSRSAEFFILHSNLSIYYK